MNRKTIVAVALSAASILSNSAPAAARAEVGVVVGIQSDQGYYDPYNFDDGDCRSSYEGPPGAFDYNEPYAPGWGDVETPDNWADEPTVGGEWQAQDDDDD